MQRRPRAHCDPVFLTLLYLLDYNCLKPVEEKQKSLWLFYLNRNVYTNWCDLFELSSVHFGTVERTPENGDFICKNKHPLPPVSRESSFLFHSFSAHFIETTALSFSVVTLYSYDEFSCTHQHKSCQINSNIPTCINLWLFISGNNSVACELLVGHFASSEINF